MTLLTIGIVIGTTLTVLFEDFMERTVLRQRKVPISREGFTHGFDHGVD